MIIIGLTGGIGSGKSTVAGMLGRHRIPVICADRLAHDAILPKTPVYRKILGNFGRTILRRDKRINRQRLGEVVFASSQKRRLLENIIHPEVIRLMKRETARLRMAGKKIVVWDVPLLFESGMDKLCDKVIVVYAPRSVQEKRIKKRDRLSSLEIKHRLASQMPIGQKKKKAHIIIDNSGDLPHTQQQVEEMVRKISKEG